MKLKSYIYQIVLAAVGAGTLGSCEDILEPTSTYVIYEDGSHLTTPADTATSLIGIIYKLQAIGDRVNILGEVRGDLVSLTTNANADLRALANFEAGDDNRYNNPRDYYAVINNCNYYIATADTNAYDSRGNQIFEKELAQVRAIRAWTYLQLALNYGSVPFYTQPLLTEQDAAEVSLAAADRKDIEGICDYFIEDLKPYSRTAWPSLHTVGSIFMSNCYFPVDMVLGDLYLWRASCKGGDAGKADYREAAKCYFRWITDTRSVGDGATKMAYNVSQGRASQWLEYSSSTGTSYGVSWSLWSPSAGAYNNENITLIPMDSASSQGYFSDVPSLYNTEVDAATGVYTTTTNFSITPSQRMQEISAEQVYCLVDENNVPQEFHAEMIEENPLLKGDLRLSGQWSTGTYNITTGGNAGQFTTQSISKTDYRNIIVYRKTEVWLRLAEALNNGGFPRMAYAILATGLGRSVVEDSVKVYCNDADIAFLNELQTSENFFNQYATRNGRLPSEDGEEGSATTMTNIGIHSLGSGYSELNPDYAYPMVDSLDADSNYVPAYNGQSRVEWAYLNMATEQAAVDSMIINELALETCFEGKRLFDLIRFAKRYNNPEWVAGSVSKRDTESSGLYGRLLDERNWFLSWKGQIGMK